MSAAARHALAPPPAPLVSCHCGARYELDSFARLVVVRVLDVDELAPLVVRWPRGATVDVRACATCAAPLARLRHAPAADHGSGHVLGDE